jgi:hypothetical protein
MGLFSEIDGIIGFPPEGLHFFHQGAGPGKTRHVRTAPARTDSLRQIDHTGTLNPKEAAQSIADYAGRGLQISLRPPSDRLFGKACNRVEAGDSALVLRIQPDCPAKSTAFVYKAALLMNRESG